MATDRQITYTGRVMGVVEQGGEGALEVGLEEGGGVRILPLYSGLLQRDLEGRIVTLEYHQSGKNVRRTLKMGDEVIGTADVEVSQTARAHINFSNPFR